MPYQDLRQFLEVLRKEGELIEIDSRPSDAIAVAVTCDPPLPIYVNEEVLNDVLDQ